MYPYSQEQELALKAGRTRKMQAFAGGRGAKVHSHAALRKGREAKLTLANDAACWMADIQMGMGA